MPFAAIAGAAVGVALNTAVQAGTGTGAFADTSGGSGGGGGSSNSSDTNNAIYGVHVSTQPLGGSEKQGTPKEMAAPKAAQAQAASPRSTPTQSVGAGYASKDFQGVWADRLSKYLDYNTRALG